jgi:filamentous hemagglutinin family protein
MAMNRRISISLVALATALAAAPVNAQTNIVPDTLPDRDLGTSVSTIGNVTTIDNGTLSGTNLFHSFETFDLAAGDIAQWVYTPGDATAITNVVNRVTGGTPSSLFGLLDSIAIPNADFFFINPAGIVFGAGAEVNVPAAAHFSTASELRFANGDVLSVTTPSGSVLSVAAPAAFGFLGGEGDISLTDIENLATTFLPGGQALTLTAANIALDNAFIGSNAMALAAVGDMAAEVALNGTSQDLLGGAITLTNGSWLQTWPGGCFAACLGNSGTIGLRAGTIAIDNSNIVADFDASVDDGGDRFVSLIATGGINVIDSAIMSNGYDAVSAGAVLISGGVINLNNAQVSTYTAGSGNAGQIAILGENVSINYGSIGSETFGEGDAGEILINANASLLINGATITSATSAVGNAGGVVLAAPVIDIFGGATISSDALAGDGDAGVILISGTDLFLTDQSSISSTTDGSGFGGAILIELSRDMTVDASSIETNSNGIGDGGQISAIVAGHLSMDSARITANSLGEGNAGSVFVSADSASLLNGSRIASNAVGDGDGGQVGVTVANALLMSGLSLIESVAGLATVGGGSFGKGGDVFVTAGSLDMDNSYLRSSSFSDGDGGSIFVAVAGELRLANISGINANSLGIGQAGNIFVEADSAIIDDSLVRSTALGEGDAGSVVMSIHSTLALTNSSIQSNAGDPEVFAPIGFGQGGDVSVGAGELSMVNSSISSNAYGEGDGGLVSVLAGDIFMAAESVISASSFGEGAAGDVEVGAATMTIAELSAIRSEARGAGNGGNVSVAVDGLLTMNQGGIFTNAGDAADGVQPAGDAGTIEVAAGSLDMFMSGIGSSAYDGGNGGAVGINVDGAMRMELSNVASDAYDTGDAGIVAIAAKSLDMTDFSFITSDASIEGDAGLVLVDIAGDLTISGISRISSNVGEGLDGISTGDAGAILVSARNLTMDEGFIYSISFGDGDSGFVGVELTGALSMTDSIISSDAAGELGNGGALFVEAASAVLTRSSIASDTYADGDAGSVEVRMAGALTLLDGSFISSDTLGGLGNGGDVTVVARDILLDSGSFISSIAYADGDGGFVDVTATNSLVLRGETAISTNVYGAGLGGAVFVTAPSIYLTDASFIASTAGELTTGDAGDVFIEAGQLVMDGGSSIATDSDGSGESGFVEVLASLLDMSGGARISTQSLNENPAGYIDITVDNLLMTGLGTSIASENLNPDEGGDNAAGSVFITAGNVVIAEGARVATNSLTGSAGDITFDMPTDGLLILEGRTFPGVIETSSGPGTGGIITISQPLAIILNGGMIMALGESGGANVQIDTPYFIASSDRLNSVAVDGSLTFANAIYDVSAGTVDADLAMVDASGVLRNQCSAARASGELSVLDVRPIGPFGPTAAVEGPRAVEPAAVSGGCN